MGAAWLDKITVHEMDVRPGGVWQFVMHGPDGTTFANRIEFIEVDEPERLVFRRSSSAPGDPGFQVTVTLVDEGAKTRLTIRQLYATTAAREFVAREYHAVEIAGQTFERFAAYLATR